MVRLLGKREWLTRMAIVCVCVNLLTLMPLWAFSDIGFKLLGLWPGTRFMVFLELVVVVVEGAIYAHFGRVGWVRGLTTTGTSMASSGAIISITSVGCRLPTRQKASVTFLRVFLTTSPAYSMA